jgi:hypothetical protein
MDEWPSKSATALICTPDPSQATAALCRNVCKRVPVPTGLLIV